MGEDNFIKDMGRRILARRKALGITQDELADRIGDIAQILSNDFMPAQILLCGAEQVDARSFFPMTVNCGIFSIRNGVVLVKTAEMVDSDHIVHLEAVP